VEARPGKTIAAPAELSGRGVHSGATGTVRLLPAPGGTGIVFRRVDLPGSPTIPANYASLDAEKLARQTTLAANGAAVHTTEHLLSAATGLGVTDLLVEIDCEEVPFADGSALPFVQLLQQAGLSETGGNAPAPLVIPRPLVYREGGAEVVALPSRDYRVTFFFTSNHPRLRSQSATYAISPETYIREIAPARTFCFFEEIEQMQKMNLIRGASLTSAVVIGRKAVLNESLRFPDEPVRHKILDLVGDLALLGAPLQGHILAWRAGHRVNAGFGRYLQKELNL